MVDDRAALNAAFARHVARVLGLAAAYHPAATCPQGHPHDDPECGGYLYPIGHLCMRCVNEAYWPADEAVEQAMTDAERDAVTDRIWADLDAHRDDPNWHPEWRIGVGEPFDFCGSLDRTVSALNALGLRWSYRTGDGVRVESRTARGFHAFTYARDETASAVAMALVRAALRVLEATPHD
ncbi:MAG: hypothetical protein K6V97_04060 [Actinomycetia bacterium]|nr:hypothetical protein [Actinomycetes bacterium]